MIKPQGISAKIPHNIPEATRDAIRFMEREYLAYLPAKQKGISFGKLYHKVGDSYFKVSYTDFYGKYIVTDILAPMDTTGWKNQTYCTIGVSTFLYYFMGYNDTDNILKISYGDSNYGKHPISIIAQNGANTVSRKLAAGQVDGYGISFKPIDKREAGRLAQKGNFIVSAWENKKGIGHVSTVIGNKEDDGGYYHEFADPMCYNIGAINGYMSLDRAYNKSANKDIRFYIVE